MILDSSAILAILLFEHGFESLVEKLASAPAAGVGAPTLAEDRSRTHGDADLLKFGPVEQMVREAITGIRISPSSSRGRLVVSSR